MNILSIGLSKARHFDSFGFDDVIYIGPRFENSSALKQYQSGNKIIISEWLKVILPEHKIDCIIVFIDPFAFHLLEVIVDIDDIPVLALVGDTHHGQAPLRQVVSWTVKNRVYNLILKQTKYQKPLFDSLGYNTLALPYYLVSPKFFRPIIKPYPKAVFVGSSSQYHTRRAKVLSTLDKYDMIDIISTPRYLSLKHFNKYAVSLNVTLASDTNYKIHEIVMSGGCLLTDIQSRSTLDYEILKQGEDYLGYDSIEQCTDLINLLIKDNSLRNKICNSGFEKLHECVTNNMLSKLITSFQIKCRNQPAKPILTQDKMNMLTSFEYFQNSIRENKKVEIPQSFKNILPDSPFL